MANAIDKEQIEMLSEWWNDYGKTLVVAVIIGLVLGFGWRFWNNHEAQNAQQASLIYAQLENAAMAHDASVTTQLTTNLVNDYGKTAYASMASLISARMNVEKNDLASALMQTTWVVNNGSDNVFKQIARINAARILLAQNKFDQALNELSTINEKSLTPMVESVKGDIYTASKKPDLAKVAYQKAQAGFDAAAVPAPLLKLLINMN